MAVASSRKGKISFEENLAWLSRAKKIIPSASQTYSKGYRYYSEGAGPAFVESASGCRIRDVDRNEFIDTVLGLGAITIGYNDERVNEAILKQLKKGMSFTLPHKIEVELAEKLTQIIPCAESLRFMKNGSDATTAAVRLARAYTNRDLILTCGYHGWHDWSIGLTSNNRGVPRAVRELSLEFKYNDLDGLKQLFQTHSGKIAAVIMEPVQLEMPKNGYLLAVKDLAQKHGALLIFDEVVAGFRIALGGAQEHFGVTPDLACFGKGMSNGAALSLVAGRKEIMGLIDEGAFISMTAGGEALSLAACLETVRILEQKGSFDYLWKIENKLMNGIQNLIEQNGLSEFAYTSHFPAHSALLFKTNSGNQAGDLQSYFQQEAFKNGILYLGIHNFCLAHTEKDIDKILNVYGKIFSQLKKHLDGGTPISSLLEGEKIRPVFERN